MTIPEMTESQHRFFELLEQAAWLRPYWDREERACRIDRLTAAMDVWSEGEQHLARFFAMVWFGQNRLGFDLLDAAAVLDLPSRMLIVHWLAEPFWP
jgi:hypothetical protein